MFKSRKSTAAGMDQGSQRKESVTTTNIRTQSAGGPPTQQMVKVAVVPPRLPPNMAPPTGLGAADAFSWQESINWQHNKKIDKSGIPEKKNFLQKAGLTTKRTKANPDIPNFTFREVPYDVWRKHYAKDKDGYYHGTHAPAEDCLLNDEDVAKWRLGEPETVADLHSRGKFALPVYEEAQLESEVPKYTDVTEERWDSTRAVPAAAKDRTSSFTADGKTTEQIINEAKEKAKIKKSKDEQWRDMLRSGVNNLMGPS